MFYGYEVRKERKEHICPPFAMQQEEKCDMIQHITKEEKTKMSCVGIMANDNGIVAFSDSRSCYQFASGSMKFALRKADFLSAKF